MQGSRRRERRELERLAWHAATTVNVWLEEGSRVTGSQLLGEDVAVEQPLLLSEDEVREHFAARVREQQERRLEAQTDEELAALEERERELAAERESEE